MWANPKFAAAFGHAFDPGSGDVALFMNGDAQANDSHVEGSSYVAGDGVYAVLDRRKSADATIRIQYLVVFAA